MQSVAPADIVSDVASQFPVVDVSNWPVESLEPGGKDEKVWLQAQDKWRWLFKPAVVRDGRRQGEDWAEKVASELATLISVPVAQVEMASRAGTSGSISRDLSPGPEWELQSGAVLISEVDPRFVPQDKDRIGHSLKNIAEVLSEAGPPPEFLGPSDLSAFDIFCGYVLFDAWIANRDRHEENWSVLRSSAGTVALAASYDHGSSLAFGLTDEGRRRILRADSGIDRWAAKGTAWRYEGSGSVSLVDFAHGALSMPRPSVREYWIEQLRMVDMDKVASAIAATPEMSEHAAMFCVRLLDVNRRRLLNVD